MKTTPDIDDHPPKIASQTAAKRPVLPVRAGNGGLGKAMPGTNTAST